MTDIELNFYGMRSQLQRLFAGEYVTALTGAGATLWEILSSGFDIR